MAKTVPTVKGTTKADVITVTEKSAAVNKKKYSVAASGVTVKAGRGNDTVQITGGNTHESQGGDGADKITVNNVRGASYGQLSNVKGGAGANTINATGSSNLYVTTEGIGSITVKNSSDISPALCNLPGMGAVLKEKVLSAG